MSILAIDAGTTGVTALVVSKSGQIIARGYQEFEQHFPKPGWVEHNPEQIWQATLAAVERALGLSDENPTAIGITNQRETAVVWNRKDLSSPTNAIVWQDRRTADLTTELERINEGDWIRKRTGLNLDPYFTSSKFLWWQRNLPEVWQGVVDGNYALGTIDSYLVARISGGASHITDCSNASRTQLMNLETGQWDDQLLQAFGIPQSALPTITPSWGNLAVSDPEHFLGLSIAINGIAGDQQAALFGQAAFDKGSSKSTYGTGAFILTNTGDEIVESSHKLLATVAWQAPDGKITYASEGSVFVAGAAVQWLRDGLKIIERSSDVEALALEAASSDGVVFVPSLPALVHRFGIPAFEVRCLGSPVEHRLPISRMPLWRRLPSRSRQCSMPWRKTLGNQLSRFGSTVVRPQTICCCRFKPMSQVTMWCGQRCWSQPVSGRPFWQDLVPGFLARSQNFET